MTLQGGTRAVSFADGREFPIGAARVSVTTFGVSITLSVGDGSWVPELVARLPRPFRRSLSGRPQLHYAITTNTNTDGSALAVTVSTGGVDTALRWPEALAFLESRMRADVASHARHWSFVHAGVVGWRGRAIVIPALSGHGKSTLVAALVRAGAVYYSDECAVIDDRGRVHAYLKALSLRQGDGTTAAIPPAELGGLVGGIPLRIGAVISTHFDPQQEWRPQHGTSGDAVLALLPHTAQVRSSPARSLRRLARAAQDCSLLVGPRGEADVTAAQILNHVQEALP